MFSAGSHNFNMMLANGGSYYIDDGKPVNGLFARTVENLSLVTGTACFNVPVGFAMLLEALEADKGLRQRFFEDLDLIFYAGASLPQDVWQGFERMAMEIRGEIPLMTSSWGMTETAPACIMQHEPVDRAGVVGVPLNDITVKLLPDEGHALRGAGQGIKHLQGLLTMIPRRPRRSSMMRVISLPATPWFLSIRTTCPRA